MEQVPRVGPRELHVREHVADPGATDVLALLSGALREGDAARNERWGPAPYFRAQVHGWLNEPGPALELLRLAYRERTPLLVLAGVDPGFDPLRDQPGFRELILRLGLQPFSRRARGSSEAAGARQHR
jgi:hypothetical protein